MEDRDFYCYEFGEFRLDARRRSLSKNGEKVPVSARNFDLLLFMVENGGRVLEHEELLDKVWAGTFVEQATLKKGISALRQILAEKPENEFIKTIPRRGYSFVSPVRVVEKNNEFFFVRETEREIAVEEYEETADKTTDAPEAVLEIPAIPLKPAEPKKFNLPRLVILGGAALALLIFVAFGLKSHFTKTVTRQFSVENVRVNRITNTGKALDSVISPDGNYLLYPSEEKEGVSLWLRQMSTNSTNRLTVPVRGGFWDFAFAPDDSYVYYIFNDVAEPSKSGLYKIPLLGGEPRRIGENVSTVAVSPDGNRIALVRLDDKTNVFTVNPDGEDERTVFQLPADLRLLGISWTPDGAALLGTFRKTVEDKPLYYVSEISAENGKETIVLPAQEKIIFGAVWLPDKSSMLMTMRESNADIRQIWQYFPASGDWRRVTNDDNSYKYVNLTRDGKTIVSNQGSRLAAIWVADDLPLKNAASDKKTLLSSAGSFKQVTDGVNNFDRLGWLADNRLMYSTTEDGKEMIFTINSDGTNARQITSGEDGIWIFPTVAGNGRSVGFLSTRAGFKQLWRVDEDGKNLTKLTQSGSPVLNARILRDGVTVIYAVQQNKGVFLFKQTGDGQTAQITDSNTGSFAVSADETMLAAETLDKNTGKYRVELLSLTDGKMIKTFDFLPSRQMIFTPDGKNLAYDAAHGDFHQIMIQPLEGGEPFAITDFQTDNIFSFDLSPDGRHLAVVRGKQLNDAVFIKTGGY